VGCVARTRHAYTCIHAYTYAHVHTTSLWQFERSMKDMFVIKARDVGPIQSVNIRHVAPPGNGGWHLAGIVVRNLRSNEEYAFSYGDVIGENNTVELRCVYVYVCVCVCVCVCDVVA
jgi:hypothetical protein